MSRDAPDAPEATLGPTQAARRPRADAQRNRERILDAARRAFSRHGADAAMDEIARRAKVGPGTLYRHFPTRDALIEALYRSEVEKLTAAGRHFSAVLSPLEALRAWMLLFIDHVATKKLILPAMETVAGGSTRLIEGARGQVHGTFLALVERAIQSGDLRAELEPGDIVRAMIGVFYTMALPGWESSARRIVEILIAGSRAAAPAEKQTGVRKRLPPV